MSKNKHAHKNGILKKSDQAGLVAFLIPGNFLLGSRVVTGKIAVPVPAKEFAMEKLTVTII